MNKKQLAERIKEFANSAAVLHEDVENDLKVPPLSAREFLSSRRNQNCCHHVRFDVADYFIRQSDFDLKRYICNNAGHQLGKVIAESLDFDSCVSRNEFGMGTVKFQADVYSFTKVELEKLIEEAIREGARFA